MIDKVQEWSAAAIKLFMGPLYRNDDRTNWNILIRCKPSVLSYFSVLGLTVEIEEEDGYAFLMQKKDIVDQNMDNEDENLEELPRLIKKTRFSYLASILLVLLRQEYDKFENSYNENDYPILHKSEIADLLRPFAKERADQTKFSDDVDRIIIQLKNLTYLKPRQTLDSTRIQDDVEFELSPIIKRKVDVSFMKEMLDKLEKTPSTSNVTSETLEEDL